MIRYYSYMWPRRSNVLAPLTESDSCSKGRAIIWNGDMEVTLRDLKHMVSAETLLNYPDQEIPFTVHTYESDEKLGTSISQNDKPIALFSIKSSKPQHIYTNTNRALLLILECLLLNSLEFSLATK